MDEQTTIRDVIEPLIGEYTPDVYTYSTYRTVVDSEGVESQVEDTNNVLIPDFAWFASVAIFILVVYSFFRAVGGLLKSNI